VLGCRPLIEVGGFAGVAVVEARHLKSALDQGGAELLVPVEHVGADADDQ
jgi:hypothetical protein